MLSKDNFGIVKREFAQCQKTIKNKAYDTEPDKTGNRRSGAGTSRAAREAIQARKTRGKPRAQFCPYNDEINFLIEIRK